MQFVPLTLPFPPSLFCSIARKNKRYIWPRIREYLRPVSSTIPPHSRNRVLLCAWIVVKKFHFHAILTARAWPVRCVSLKPCPAKTWSLRQIAALLPGRQCLAQQRYGPSPTTTHTCRPCANNCLCAGGGRVHSM